MLLKKTLATLLKNGFGDYQIDFVFGVKQVRLVSVYQSEGNLILTNTMARNAIATTTLKDLCIGLKFNANEILGELNGNNDSYSTFSGIDIDHRTNTAIFTWLVDEEYPKEDQYLLDAS